MTDQASRRAPSADVAAEFIRAITEDANWRKAHPCKAAARNLRWTVSELLGRLADRRAAGRHAAR